MNLDEFESEYFNEFEQARSLETNPGHSCCATCKQRELEDGSSEYSGEEEFEVKPSPKPVVSPLAKVSKYGLNNRGRVRRFPVYGVVVHTTGGGPAKRARLNRASGSKRCQVAFDCALKVYAAGDGFAHYLIDYDGKIACTCSEGREAWHSGRKKAAVGYLRQNGAPPWWTKVWGAKQSPFALTPDGRSPNAQYIGIELLQTESGGSFSDAQYRALAELVLDIERRHGLKFERPPNRALLGHEDVNPAPYQGGKIGGRSLDSLKAGWDPGASRGWFSWAKLWTSMRGGGSGVQGFLPAQIAPRAPAAPSPLKRLKNGRGMAGYTSQRLDDTLRALRAAGRLSVTDEQIDLFQRIANVETGGGITALNTYDSAIVSIGFMQWTLSHGKIQTWIRAAAPAFKRHGIELDSSATYSFKNGAVAAIRGASVQELRFSPWAERFYQVGFDADAIVAEVALAIRMIANEVARVRAWYGPVAHQQFLTHYQASAWLRAIFHEAYNNRPVAAKAAVKAALDQGAGLDTARFLERFKQEIRRAFAARNELQKAVNVINKTSRIRL